MKKDGTIIFFTSPSCGPCVLFNQEIVERLNKEYSHRDRITIIRFNDTSIMPGIYKEICESGGIPNLVVFKNGEKYFEIRGHPKDIEGNLKTLYKKVDETLKN